MDNDEAILEYNKKLGISKCFYLHNPFILKCYYLTTSQFSSEWVKK